MGSDLPPGDALAMGERAGRCVVLLERASRRGPAPDGEGCVEVDGVLRSLLAARGWEINATDDPCLSMAEVCLLERSAEARATWGLDRADELAFVLVKPAAAAACRRARQLIEAIARHVPAVSIWLFDDGRLSPLARQTGAEGPRRAASSRPAPPAPPPDGRVPPRGAPDDLRLVSPPPGGEEHLPPPPPDDEQDDALEVSAEEIAMLFGSGAGEEEGP